MLRKVLRAFIFGGIAVALVTIDCVYIDSREKVCLVNFVKAIK